MKNYIGKKAIIRADRAGVFYGSLESIEPLGDKFMVEIKDCRRIWRWEGACSLSQLAVDGTTKPDECRFSVAVENIVIAGVVELIPCTEKSIKSIESVYEWKL